MYGENGTKIMVYNMKRYPKKRGDWKRYRKKIKKYDTKGRTSDSWLYYSCCADDDFYIFYLQLPFQTIHNRYLLFKFMLVLSPILYKFIVWACWTWTQSYFSVQVKIGPYKTYIFFNLIFKRIWLTSTIFLTGHLQLFWIYNNKW